MKFLNKILKISSISPDSSICQNIISYFFKKIGFQIFKFKKKGVKNTFMLHYSGKNRKKIDVLFLGHTDVVPVNRKIWLVDPFNMNLKNGLIISRGICDMKGSIYSAYICIKNTVKKKLNGNIAVMLSGDEEGNSLFGARELVLRLSNKFKIINCIIGEPTSKKIIGDTIRNGRRGSINFILKLQGSQQHNAYPKNSKNLCLKIPLILRLLSKMNCFFFNIEIPNSRSNIIPGLVNISLNIRFRYYSELKHLKYVLQMLSKKIDIKFRYKLISISKPFYKKSKRLLNFYKSIPFVKNKYRIVNNKGGTSDGRFLKKISSNIVELGLLNKYIHMDNERVKVSDIYLLSNIYYHLISNILNTN
ncbi:succinyl-diaminopimelate desuccinylase [Candidatus Vidania fulgoroideorum]